MTELIARLDQVRGEHEQHRSGHLEQIRAAATLGNEISGLESQVAAAAAARERGRGRMADLDRQHRRAGRGIGRPAPAARRAGAKRAIARRTPRGRPSRNLPRQQRELAIRNDELAALRQRRSGVAERAAVLEELHRRQEGVTAGVKEVLAKAAGPDAGPLACRAWAGGRSASA